MKKIILFIFFLSAIDILSAQKFIRNKPEPKQSNPEYILGYCSDRLFNGIGSGKSDFLKAVIQIPVETATRFKGNKLTKVRIGIGDIGFSNTKIFLSYTKEGKPFYSQNVTFTGYSTWDEIKLDTPYEIEDKEFFIGYSLISRNQTMPVITDDRPTNPHGGWVSLANQWYRIPEIQKIGNLSIRGIIEGDKVPLYDLALESVYMNSFVKPGQTFKISSVLTNKATATIKSFIMSYQIDEDTPVVTTFDHVDIEYNKAFYFSVDAVVQKTGKRQVKVRITAPNQKEDEDISNNELVDTINCGGNFIQRKILLEHFATRSLSETIDIIDNFKGVASVRDNINWITHFAGYGTDEEFTLPASVTYTWLYNEGPYANGAMIDRTCLSEYQPKSGSKPIRENSSVFNAAIWSWSWGEEVKTFLGRLMDAQLKKNPALVKIDISKSYNDKTHLLKASVSARKLNLSDFGELGNNLRLNVFLLEDKVRTDQAASGGTIYYKYDNVIREVLSETWGDEIMFSGDIYSKEYEYTIPIKWDAKNLKMMAFVSNYDSKDPLNCHVYNSESLEITGSITSDAVSVTGNKAMTYVQDSRIVIKGEFKVATVYDMMGRIIGVMDKSISSFNLANGIYVIKIDASPAEKVIVSN